ncbi:MAG: hypothetical protein QNJ54_30570 [Prochloraceae cyanobacterium]|nr:hypothetical protein [Prochloraceae cyanobacterium]
MQINSGSDRKVVNNCLGKLRSLFGQEAQFLLEACFGKRLRALWVGKWEAYHLS